MEAKDAIDLRVPGQTGAPLLVWWIPQVPMKSFTVLLNSFVAAKVLLESLAQYDMFQFDNNIKPDYCNTGGLMVQDDGTEYTDWESDEGSDIDSLPLEECAELDRRWASGELRISA